MQIKGDSTGSAILWRPRSSLGVRCLAQEHLGSAQEEKWSTSLAASPHSILGPSKTDIAFTVYTSQHNTLTFVKFFYLSPHLDLI